MRKIKKITKMTKSRTRFFNIKDLQENLLKKENRFKLFFEHNTDAIFIADAKTKKIVECNKRAEYLTGYSRKNILSMRANLLHPRHSVAKAMACFKKQASGRRISVESEIITRNKGSVPVEISATALFLNGKRYLIGIFRDITDRKKSEESLRQSEKRYRLLSEMSEDPIFIIGRDGIISYVNTFGAAYFRKKPADMIGSRISDFFKHKISARMMKNIGKVFKTGRPVFTFGEFDFHGSKFWLDTRLSPLTDDSGKVTHVMGTSRDVTSHRHAQEVLERDKVDLEKMVIENSRKLLEAQKRLDRTDRLAYMGTISATVAHELRSPLAAIRIAAYNIRTKSKDPNLENNIRNIEIKVLESDQIIKNMLLYSSIKSPMREKVKICGLISESIDLAKSCFPDHEVRIRKTLKCPTDMMMEADPVQLQEVFNNILNNSFECFIDKKGEIDVSASVETGEWYKVVIKDNGPGIDPNTFAHIYEPFVSTKSGGTGLGIPVCRQIINLHKGSMNIYSKPGKGTKITIRLPLGNNKVIVAEKSKKACLPAGREGV